MHSLEINRYVLFSNIVKKSSFNKKHGLTLCIIVAPKMCTLPLENSDCLEEMPHNAAFRLDLQTLLSDLQRKKYTFIWK